MPRPRKSSLGTPRQPNGADAYARTYREKHLGAPAEYPLGSQIPTAVRLPLLVLLSLTLSLFLLQLFSQYYSGGEMGAISKTLNSWPEISAVVGWKIMELVFVWWMGYDAWDAAYFTVLTHSPPLSLLTTFYNIRPTVAIGHLLIDVLALAVPLRLLRTNLPVHATHPPKSSVSNRAILTDPSTTISTAILSTCIYALALYAAYSTFLPEYMVTRFELQTLENVHKGASGLPQIILSCIPIGYAAKEFIFVSSTSASKGLTTSARDYFDPAEATLSETVYHNAWGWYTTRQKVLIARTLSVMLMMALHTYGELLGKMKGVTWEGASGWCALWEVATVTAAVAYWWVGAVDGV